MNWRNINKPLEIVEFVGLKKWVITNLENIFLILFVGILLWMSLGPLMQYRLVHENPTGFGAGDAYHWEMQAQYIYDSGSYKFSPPFLHFYMQDIATFEPPILQQLTAYLSYSLGIPVYDTLMLLATLLVVLSILIFFMIVKEYNEYLAYLSMPLCVLSFTFPFVVGIVFGFFPAIAGLLFLFASLFMLLHMDLKHSTIVLGVFIAAMTMAHTNRLFEFAFFGGAFVALAILFKNQGLSFIKKLVISSLIAGVISLYYLAVFVQRLKAEASGAFSYTQQGGSKYLNINLNDFEIVKYIIIAGLVLCLYFAIKERKSIKSGIFVFPIIAFLLVYFLKISRIYQITFLWPVFLSLAFGLMLYWVLQLRFFSKINKSRATYVVISLAISILLIYQYYYFFREPVLEKISETGTTTTKNQWQDLMWISKNTESEANVLFFYFNDNPYDVTSLILSSKRASFYIPLDKLDLAIQEKRIKQDYGILAEAGGLFYKRDETFPLKITRLDKNSYLKNWTLCDFDYVYGKRTVYVVDEANKQFVDKVLEYRVLYTMDVMNILLENKNFKVVHQSNESVIIKNYKPGEECI